MVVSSAVEYQLYRHVVVGSNSIRTMANSNGCSPKRSLNSCQLNFKSLFLFNSFIYGSKFCIEVITFSLLKFLLSLKAKRIASITTCSMSAPENSSISLPSNEMLKFFAKVGLYLLRYISKTFSLL